VDDNRSSISLVASFADSNEIFPGFPIKKQLKQWLVTLNYKVTLSKV